MAASWIEASRSPVVPFTKVHAMAVTPLFLFVVWWSWITFGLLLIVTATMCYLQMKGRNPVWVVRRFVGRMRGDTVQARPLWYRRRRARLHSYDEIDVRETYSLKAEAAPSPKKKAANSNRARPGSTEGNPT